ncbi:unnamed protein product [Camellia sinensis]
MDDPSHIPPTAPERRHHALTNPVRARGRGRGRGHDIMLEEAPQILQEDVIDNALGDDAAAADVDQVEEVLTGPFPGGPSDPSILKSFKAHIAAAIWDQKERNPLRCYNHASKILEWRWWSRTDNRRFRDIVQQSGLSSLVHCTYRFVNRIVISAFVERWQPETNTFHLKVGEMTMTLDDVGTILGIPITGRLVSATTLTDQQAHALVVAALGVDDAEAIEELSSASGQSIKLEWLRSKFSGCKDSDTEESIVCAAERICYFYWDVHYSATRVGREFLLCTCSYQLPHQNMEYTIQLPHMHRWTPRREASSTVSHLQALREELDRLTFDEVTWDPYRDCCQHHPCHEITFYSGCLKCLDVVEPYHPERVLRQFGRVQTIPLAPLDPFRAVRGVTTDRYKVMYQYLDQIWESWDNHVLSARKRSTPVRCPANCVDGYIQWYANITHLYIQNTTHRSGFDPRAHDSRFDVQDAERIDHALWIAHPIIEAGHDASVRELDRLYEAIERMSRVLQGQQIDEAGPSSIPFRTYNRRRRVHDR